MAYQSFDDNKCGHFEGGFFVRTHRVFKKGEVNKGHFHYVGHLSVIMRGGFRIDYFRLDGTGVGSADVVVGADNVPIKVPIAANMVHVLTALADDSMFECWFSAHEADRVFREPGLRGFFRRLIGRGIKGSDGVPWTDCKSDV